MFGGMKQKLQEMQQQMEVVKARLETIQVTGEAASGKIKVAANGNRKITTIDLNAFDGTQEELADQVLLATNRALEQAEKVYEAEMQGMAKGVMPNIPGLF